MKKIYKIHSWLGLFNGAWLLILGISGAMLVYYPELDKLLNKEVLTASATGQRLPIDSLYKIVRAKHPEAMGTNIMRFPQAKMDCISFRIYIQDGQKPIIHWWETYNMDIDPYTGKILREGYYRDIGSSFMHWLLNFHWSLHAGPAGELIIAIAGILLFINIITGIIVYRKYVCKALIFKAPFKWKNWRTVSSGLHRYIGVWSLIFNVLIFYSGLQMNWHAFNKTAWEPPQEMPRNNEPYANMDAMVAEVQHIYPGFEMKYFYIPFSKKMENGSNIQNVSLSGNIPGTPTIIPQSSSNVVFNVNTGKVISSYNVNEEIKKLNLWEKFNKVAYSFHVGSFAGEFSRILYVFIGLMPGFLALSGFMLWWRRARKKSSKIRVTNM